MKKEVFKENERHIFRNATVSGNRVTRIFFAVLLLFIGLVLPGCGAGGAYGTESPGYVPAISSVGEEYVTDIEVSQNADGVIQAVQHIFAMDTEMMIEAFGENAEAAVRAAGEEVLRIDQLLSVGIKTSDIARLNLGGSTEVSELTGELITRGIEIGKITDGAFDVTVYPLMEAWGFTGDAYHVPKPSEIEKLLAFVGTDKVTVDGKSVQLAEGTQLDLGGIAKG